MDRGERESSIHETSFYRCYIINYILIQPRLRKQFPFPVALSLSLCNSSAHSPTGFPSPIQTFACLRSESDKGWFGSNNRCVTQILCWLDCRMDTSPVIFSGIRILVVRSVIALESEDWSFPSCHEMEWKRGQMKEGINEYWTSTTTATTLTEHEQWTGKL